MYSPGRATYQRIGLTPCARLCRPFRAWQCCVMSPLQVGCSKLASKTYAFFANGFMSFDYPILRKVNICPFFNMAVPAYLQAFFEIEFNSSGFISKMET